MSQVEQLQAQIDALSEQDFIRLREWFAEKAREIWDKQLETDITDGKLDFLLEEAMNAKAVGTLRNL